MHSLEIKTMLSDSIHHNKNGGELWGALQARHFEEQSVLPSSWQSRISTIQPLESNHAILGKLKYDSKDWTNTKRWN